MPRSHPRMAGMGRTYVIPLFHKFFWVTGPRNRGLKQASQRFYLGLRVPEERLDLSQCTLGPDLLEGMFLQIESIILHDVACECPTAHVLLRGNWACQ